MTPIDDFTPEEFDQFRYLIGCYFFQSPVACLFARHTRPLNTLRDYFDILPDLDKVDKAARQFVVDFARITNLEHTKALVDKWHGPNAVARRKDEENDLSPQ
jgi:hypothetical protein